MRASSLAPSTVAGVTGMLLAAALYVAYALSLQTGGRGLSPPWLAALALPGALSAHLCRRRGMQNASPKEGALSGLITAHFVASLQVSVLALAAASIDWTRYAGQVGPEVANAVHDAALPITVGVAGLLVVLTYAGCTFAGWIGALAYVGIDDLLERSHGREESD